MNLPDPTGVYDVRDQRENRRVLRIELEKALKRGSDIELTDERLILRSPNGSRYALTVDNSGNLGTTAL